MPQEYHPNVGDLVVFTHLDRNDFVLVCDYTSTNCKTTRIPQVKIADGTTGVILEFVDTQPGVPPCYRIHWFESKQTHLLSFVWFERYIKLIQRTSRQQ